MVDPAFKRTRTPAEYLEWERCSPIKNEYVRGETFAMAGSTDDHNDVAANIHRLLRAHLRGGACRAYMADVKLRVEAADAYFYPDVFVTCDPRDHQDRLVKRSAVLVVEVLSDSTAEYDRGDKFTDYRQLEELRECVLVDSRQRRIEVFQRDDGGWRFLALRSEDPFILESVGFETTVAAVYDDTNVPDRLARVASGEEGR